MVAHSPSLILAAATEDEKLMSSLRKAGVEDTESLKRWFTVSEKWVEVDAEALCTMYASTMIESEKMNWIDWKTAREIKKGMEEHARVIQAAVAFTLYKKGMFVKKGLVSASKLMGLHSMIIRNLPKRFY